MAKRQVSLDPQEALSYRTPMTVSIIRRFRFFTGVTYFPVCPRCQATMEREFQSFCDRCGQALDWSSFSKATIVS